MHLYELTRPQSISDASEILYRNGYQEKGSGNFATVFYKPGTNYVLKLFKSNDEGYLTFIKYVLNHPNPHFPKLYSKIIKITDAYYAIKIEELSPLSTSSAREIEEVFYEFYEENIVPTNVDPSMLEAMQQILDLMKKNNLGNDMGDNNIMQRKDGTIVFSDPIWGYSAV